MILFEVTVCDLRMSTQIVDLKSQFATSKMDWRIRWQKISAICFYRTRYCNAFCGAEE